MLYIDTRLDRGFLGGRGEEMERDRSSCKEKLQASFPVIFSPNSL